MRFRSWWPGLLVMCVLVAIAAADTGGSMGGGDWGGGGGDSGGGYSGGADYSSSSSDYSSSSSDYSSSSDDNSSGSSGTRFPVPIMVLFAVVALAALATSVKESRGMQGGHAYALPVSAVDVSVLRIAIDGRARRFVQAALGRIAQQANTRTAEGRHHMLSEVTLLLRRVREAWVYGGAVNEPMRYERDAQVAFHHHVTDARARFRTETIRNAQGVVTTQVAPASIPRSHEGEGLILVSIIVAARSELFTVRHIGDGEDLRKALEAAVYRHPRDLVAVEVIWQPSDDADRLSSIELEAKYPAPILFPILGALVGKTFCSYCSGPYPAELVTCPHCGAPGEGRPAQAA